MRTFIAYEDQLLLLIASWLGYESNEVTVVHLSFSSAFSKDNTTYRGPLTVYWPRLVRLSKLLLPTTTTTTTTLSLPFSFVFDLKIGEVYHNMFCNSLYPGLARFQINRLVCSNEKKKDLIQPWCEFFSEGGGKCILAMPRWNGSKMGS